MGSNLSKDKREEQNLPPTKTSLSNDNSSMIALGECRMCFEKQISTKNPIVQLGCNCLGENSCAHESCIRKWFTIRSINVGDITCEICKAKLGKQARSIVHNEIRSLVWKYLLRRGFVKVMQLFGDMIFTVITRIQSLNDTIEVEI